MFSYFLLTIEVYLFSCTFVLEDETMSTDIDRIKIFVLDTNVLIHNPESIMSFRDNEIVIPLQVLEELDRL